MLSASRAMCVIARANISCAGDWSAFGDSKKSNLALRNERCALPLRPSHDLNCYRFSAS
jgi:hypothetical protein